MPDVIRSARHLHGLLQPPHVYCRGRPNTSVSIIHMYVNNIMKRSHLVDLSKTVYKGNKNTRAAMIRRQGQTSSLADS